jgi:putative ABC transport system permease protein
MNPLLISGFGVNIKVDKRRLIIKNPHTKETIEIYPHSTTYDSIIVDGHTGSMSFEVDVWYTRGWSPASARAERISGRSTGGWSVVRAFAKSKHIKPGDTIEILNHNFRVAGIVAQGRGARKFLPLATLQDLMGAKDKASLFYLKLDDPSNADAVVNEIKAVPGMERYVATSMAYYLSMMTPSNYPGLSSFITVVIAISVIIGFIVIFQAMYTAVMERTREIGILKSLGASKVYIVNVILRETVLLALCGIVAGILFSLAAKVGITQKLPLLRVVVTGEWILKATVVAIVGAILGAVYPAFKAAQKDPIEALAYE